MQNTALNRLQPVVDVGDGTIENNVARVFEKPVAIALGKGGGVVLYLDTLFSGSSQLDRRDGGHVVWRFGGGFCLGFRLLGRVEGQFRLVLGGLLAFCHLGMW